MRPGMQRDRRGPALFWPALRAGVARVVFTRWQNRGHADGGSKWRIVGCVTSGKLKAPLDTAAVCCL